MHRKDVFSVLRVLEHAQARAHRRERRGAAHHVFAEAHVNMRDREEDEDVLINLGVSA